MSTRFEDAYARAVEALQAADYARARDQFGVAIKSRVTPRWEALYGRAWATVVDDDYRNEETLKQAAEDLDQAMELAEEGADIAALRGRVAYLTGELEVAIRFLLTALTRCSQRSSVERHLTDALNDLLWSVEREPVRPEDVEVCDRIEQILRVADVAPTVQSRLLAEVISARAFCRQQLGEEELAEADLAKLAAVAPGHPRLPARTLQTTVAVQPAPSETTEPTFDSIGGADATGTFIAELRQLFDVYLSDSDPQVVRDKLAEFGQSPSRSVLLFGPSGCGKTYIVRAFGGEYRRRHGREIPLHKIKLDEIYGRYVGENEQNITRIFDRAIETQPSILFCDEIDGVGSSRESGEAWRKETTGHFLQQVDRLKDEGASVIFFGCTNRVWAVDHALQRRFDRLIPAEMPNEQIRAEIFEVHLARMSERLRSPTIDLAELARRSHGLTPGDIKKVVSKAIDDLLSEGAETGLTQERLLAALPDRSEIAHVQDWIRESLLALRRIGQNDMAENLERMYGPYMDDGQIVVIGPARPRIVVPVGAWTERPSFDLSYLRKLRERM